MEESMAKSGPTASASSKTYSFTIIDPPGNVIDNGIGPVRINNSGQSIWNWFDDNFIGHGLLVNKGNITNIDVPAAINGTYPQYINDAGRIVGSYVDENSSEHGYLDDK